MITGVIKNKIDKIWEDIWAAGLTMPFKVIEQITYLMFIRKLDEKEIDNEKRANSLRRRNPNAKVEMIFPQTASGQGMRWCNFKTADPEVIFNTIRIKVFPAIREMKYGQLPDVDEIGKIIPIPDDPNKDQRIQSAFSKFMKDALFELPTPEVLVKVITGLDDLYQHDIGELDMQGDLYEYMLSKAASSGTNGQFRTPKHIRDMMVALIDPNPDDTICDPACGTAGFLISSAEHIRSKYGERMTDDQWERFNSTTFSGFDTDNTMLRISAMNLMLHGITHPDIDYKNSVSEKNDIDSEYTVCLANPPFKGTVDAETISTSLKAVTNTKKTELLFLALFLRMLKKGGRCACIVPDGVLFGSSKAHKAMRKELIEKHVLQAVISMPSGVFKPYAGVSTAILVFMKTGTGGTENVWFYDMEADGYSLDDKRNEVKENDIPDIITRFHNLEAEKERERTEKSFFVAKQEIIDNDYDLSINKYKKVEYVPVEYPPTSEIMASLKARQMEIDKGLAELERMLK